MPRRRLDMVVPYLLLATVGAPLAALIVDRIDRARAGETIAWRNPWALVLLGGCLLLAWVGFHLRRGRVATIAFARVAELDFIRRGPVAYLVSLPAALRILAVALFALALARPQTYRTEDIEVEGIDIMVILDMSRSMEETDLRRNRLDAAQRTIRRFIVHRKEDRIGLVVFGQMAMLQCPLTTDYRAIDQIVADLALGDVPEFGTAIGDALALGLASLRRSDARSKVAILLSDGDSNWTSKFDPDEAGRLAADGGVKVFTVLVGEENGGWLTGNAVNPELMRDLARRTGGLFFRAGDDRSLDRSFEVVRKTLEKTRRKVRGRVPDAELYPYLLLPALALLLLERLLAASRLRRFP
jgi:Ca-activated chloride channel family protein